VDQKKIIINLYKKLKNKDPYIRYEDLLDILSEGTNIGIGTIKKTLSEYKSTGMVSSPINKKKRPTISEKVDDFDKNEIRRKIHGFWFKREIPTIQKIIQEIKDDSDLPDLSRTSFQRLLKYMQFEYTKINSNNALTEKMELILWRRKYISEIRRYREEGRTIYYLTESWNNVRYCSSSVCVDTSVQSHRDECLRRLTTDSRKSSGKGKQIIFIHIGSSKGFVSGGLLCFETKENTINSHNKINSDTFIEWFCRILPLLNDNAVIVMNNTPYNSVKKECVPTTSWKKDAILEWLKSKDVVINKPKVKFELLEKVRQIKQNDKYIIDEEAKKQNKIVLRFPQYHSELNPIESAWSVVKEHVKTNNKTFKLNDIRKLIYDGIKQVTPEMWSNYMLYTLKEEDNFWQVDFISDEILEEIDSHVLMIKEEVISDSENSD